MNIFKKFVKLLVFKLFSAFCGLCTKLSFLAFWMFLWIVLNVLHRGYLIFSSPEPKGHMWAYSIGRHAPSIRRRPYVVHRQHFQTTSPLKPWSWFLPYFRYSIYRQGQRNIVSVPIWLELWLLWQHIHCSCNWLIMRKNENLVFTAISVQIFWQKFYRNFPWVVLYQPYEFCPNLWILLVVMATEMPNLRKKYSKSSPQKP